MYTAGQQQAFETGDLQQSDPNVERASTLVAKLTLCETAALNLHARLLGLHKWTILKQPIENRSAQLNLLHDARPVEHANRLS